MTEASTGEGCPLDGAISDLSPLLFPVKLHLRMVDPMCVIYVIHNLVPRMTCCSSVSTQHPLSSVRQHAGVESGGAFSI